APAEAKGSRYTCLPGLQSGETVLAACVAKRSRLQKRGAGVMAHPSGTKELDSHARGRNGGACLPIFHRRTGLQDEGRTRCFLQAQSLSSCSGMVALRGT